MKTSAASFALFLTLAVTSAHALQPRGYPPQSCWDCSMPAETPLSCSTIVESSIEISPVSVESAPTTTLPGPELCAAECSPVSAAALSCTYDFQCLCPTILANGTDCLSCLESVGDMVDASRIADGLSICAPPSTAATVTLAPPPPPKTAPASTAPVASTTSLPIQFTSGAKTIRAEGFGAGYISVIMCLAVIAGLFSVLV